MLASSSRGGMNFSMLWRCEWCWATSGVGISSLKLGIWLHSSTVGRSNLPPPSTASKIKPLVLRPDVFTRPEHDEREYGNSGPAMPKRSKNSVLANDTLLWSSNMAYILCDFSGFPRGYTFRRTVLAQDFPENPLPHI